MSDLGEFFFGSDTETKSKSLLSPEQQELLSRVSKMLSSGLSRGATPSKYPSYTQTPDLLTQSFEQAGSLFGTGQSTIIKALTEQAAGVPAYAFDPGRSAGLWNENFARPLMTSWRENVAPVVAESYNVPGMARSTLTSRGVSDASNRYFTESVQPSLWSAYQTGMNQEFQSLENAAGRRLAGATALGQLPAIASSGAMQVGQAQLTENERILAALRGEEFRLMPEYNPYMQSALGLSTTPTMENIVYQGEEGLLSPGNLTKMISAAMMAAGMAA